LLTPCSSIRIGRLGQEELKRVMTYFQGGRLKTRTADEGARARPGKAFDWRSLLLILVSATLLSNCSRAPEQSKPPNTENWEDRLTRIVWVAYSPPSSDPLRGIEATPEAIRDDLAVLRRAGFTGLVTYGSAGVLGRELPALAKSAGFEGVIMGVWDPSDQREIDAAKIAAGNPVVLGFCVGNEGLQSRYQLPALSAVVEELRQKTGKPVTTSEIIEKYSDESLLSLGDWVFPNAHPYFHNQLDPDDAVRWTRNVYDDLKRRSGRVVLFKEVGLPTEGDPRGKLSEEVQERYYLELARTGVRYVYFEAFDQPWKTHLPVEPHWGIFNSDRTPKSLGRRLMSNPS
jgi:exo-beta-1,3-glucanase (GH17 family)